MKIVAAADIHGRMSVYEWLITAAKGQMADLAVLAGDLSAGSWSEQEHKDRSGTARQHLPKPEELL